MINVTELSEENQHQVVATLQKCWGDSQHFTHTLQHSKTLFDSAVTADEIALFAEAFYHRVYTLWVQYFRVVFVEEMLDNALRSARAHQSKADSTTAFSLWVGYSIHKSILSYLRGQRGRQRCTIVLEALNTRQEDFVQTYQDTFHSLEEVEKGLRHWADSNTSLSLTPMEKNVIFGFIIESARREARDLDLLLDTSSRKSLPTAISTLMHNAEVCQAKQHFLDVGQKAQAQHTEALQRRLLPVMGRKIEVLSKGIGLFQRTVEASLCPYPEPMLYVRGLIQHYYAQAQRSSYFDGLNDNAQIEARYRHLQRDPRVNLPVLHLSKALAVFGSPQGETNIQQRLQRVLTLDLVQLFQWPQTFAQAIANTNNNSTSTK